MRLLFISHCLPYPPNKGERVRAFHEIKALARSHEVHLLALAKAGEETHDWSLLRDVCTTVEVFSKSSLVSRAIQAAKGIGRRPLTLPYFWSASLMKRVVELRDQGGFDVVVCYSSAMAPYGERFAGVPRVLDMVDVDSAKWGDYAEASGWPSRFLYSLEARRLRRYEREISGGVFDLVVVATNRERAILEKLAPGGNVLTVRNGVDTEYFEPIRAGGGHEQDLVFTGQMDYRPNVDAAVYFAREIFPALRRRIPGVRFVVVGRSPTRQVRALETIPGVSITGEVEDVRPFVGGAIAFVAPLRIARGIQNKVLEAMAMNVPVVCTQAVHAGLEDGGLQAGRDHLVASSTEEFVELVTELIQNQELGHRIAKNGRQRLLDSYSWEENFAELSSRLLEFENVSVAPSRRNVSP